MEAHLELRPGLSSAPRHYQKHCWPFFHLANASMSSTPSSLSTLLSFSVYTLVFFNLLYLSLDSCTVISSYPQPRSIHAPRLSPFPPLSRSHSITFFCPSLFLSIPHLYVHTGVKGLQNADSHQMKEAKKRGWGRLARWLHKHSLLTQCWARAAGQRYIFMHSYFHTAVFICLRLQLQKASVGVVIFVRVTLYSRFDISLD